MMTESFFRFSEVSSDPWINNESDNTFQGCLKWHESCETSWTCLFFLKQRLSTGRTEEIKSTKLKKSRIREESTAISTNEEKQLKEI